MSNDCDVDSFVTIDSAFDLVALFECKSGRCSAGTFFFRLLNMDKPDIGIRCDFGGMAAGWNAFIGRYFGISTESI